MSIAQFLHESYPWWAVALGLLLGCLPAAAVYIVGEWRIRRMWRQYRRTGR